MDGKRTFNFSIAVIEDELLVHNSIIDELSVHVKRSQVIALASFPERLAELIRIHQTSKKELAEYLGIHYRNLRYYETGERKPDFDKLIKLADYFGVSIDYLVGRSDKP